MSAGEPAQAADEGADRSPDRDVVSRSRLRRQPPVHSPLTAAALVQALRIAALPGHDPRERLRAVLLDSFAGDGVLLTDSGTSALRLAIRHALDGTGADTVALPAFCCYDIATAAVGANARVRLYDVDPDTLAPDLASLEAALRAGARAAVIAPLYGVPVAWEPLEILAAAHGAVLIEDAAQGHGATWQDRPLGALGPLSVLSFGRGKGWTGSGGGALLWRNATVAPAIRLREPSAGETTRSLTAAAAQWALGRPAIYGVPASLPWLGLGETHYRPPTEPRAMSAAQAGLALATREAADAEAATRRSRAALLLERCPASVTPVHAPAGGTAGYLRLPVRVDAGRSTRLVAALRHLGVAASYPGTLATLAALQVSIVDSPDRPLPGAAVLVRELVTLPTHRLLRAAEIDLLLKEL